MSQLLEQALNDIQPLTLSSGMENTDQLPPQTRPVVLMPVLPSSAIDEIFLRFGFKPNSRIHLIKHGLFPKGAAVRGRAMRGSLYPSLAIDLIALLARQESEPENEVARRLQVEISELMQTPLFNEVLQNLAHYLPVGQPLSLSYISRLFWPTATLEETEQAGAVGNLKLDWLGRMNYEAQQRWYWLALVQQQVRRLIFTERITQVEPGQVLPMVVPPVSEIKTGYVDGDSHSPPGYMKAVFKYSSGIMGSDELVSIEGTELVYEEEFQIKYQTLEWLGCHFADMPVARIEASLDRFDSRLLFYLPGFVPPDNHLAMEALAEFFKRGTIELPKMEGFVDQPLTEEDIAEVMAELEQEGYL